MRVYLIKNRYAQFIKCNFHLIGRDALQAVELQLFGENQPYENTVALARALSEKVMALPDDQVHKLIGTSVATDVYGSKLAAVPNNSFILSKNRRGDPILTYGLGPRHVGTVD